MTLEEIKEEAVKTVKLDRRYSQSPKSWDEYLNNEDIYTCDMAKLYDEEIIPRYVEQMQSDILKLRKCLKLIAADEYTYPIPEAEAAILWTDHYEAEVENKNIRF